jgi:hypothetical protein
MISRPLAALLACASLFVCARAELASAQSSSPLLTLATDAHRPDSAVRRLALQIDSSVVEAPAIADNSFLIEEAYNQDAGTVQHISAFNRTTTGDWAYGFTDEWAVRGQRHQLSATIPLARVRGDSTSAWGLGDVALNYRYQISGVDGGPIAAAPRISIVAPTGSASHGLGVGAMSLQVMLPVSIATGQFVNHFNAGVSRIGRPATRSAEPMPHTSYTLGHSLVWLAATRLNFLVETVWTTLDLVDGAGAHSRERQMIVSPGVRWSYNLPHDLQIVPGVGVPLGVGPSRGDRSVFLYLSFEHPY